MSEVLFQCVIPGRARILKNNKKLIRLKSTGRMIPVSSDRYKKWEIFASLFISRARKLKTIDYPVNVQMVFYFKDHQHESDLSNCYQGIEDTLQKCDVIKDDKLIYSHDGSRKVFDEANERVEIIITKFVK